MPFIKQKNKPVQHVYRFYKEEEKMIERLTKALQIPEVEVVREALREKYAFHFNK